MCAIYGFIARKDNAVNVSSLAQIVKGNISRGPHAFGLSWIDADGRLHCYKQSGRLTDYLPVLRMATGARMLIGHLRYATHGEPGENINNHPHPADGGWIVHNGVIGNYHQLVREYQLPIVSRCDSEVLGLMTGMGEDKLIDRAAGAIAVAEGNLAMMGLWSRPEQMVVARRGNPLHVSDTAGGLYFASLANGMPGKPGPLMDDTIRVYRRKSGVIRFTRKPLEAARAGPEWDDEQDAENLFDAPATKPREAVTRLAGRWLNREGRVCG